MTALQRHLVMIRLLCAKMKSSNMLKTLQVSATAGCKEHLHQLLLGHFHTFRLGRGLFPLLSEIVSSDLQQANKVRSAHTIGRNVNATLKAANTVQAAGPAIIPVHIHCPEQLLPPAQAAHKAFRPFVYEGSGNLCWDGQQHVPRHPTHQTC